MSIMGDPPFTDQLKRFIESSGESRYSISKRTGIDQAVLSRFMSGTGGMSLGSINKLMDAMGLEIRRRKTKGA